MGSSILSISEIIKKVVLELDGQGNQTARNVQGTNTIARTAEGETLYYMYNGHGDVTALLDAAGSIAATYYYDAFGNPIDTTGEASNPFRYSGYQYDEETGIYYLNARYYDPKIARFLTEDTYLGSIADPLSLNLYAYCHNEPVMYYDPTGHVEACDAKLSKEDQEKIMKATEKYYNAKTEKERDEAHREAVEIRKKSGKLNDYKDNYKYGTKHTGGKKEYDRIVNEAKNKKDKDDTHSRKNNNFRENHKKDLNARGITETEYGVINGIIRNNLKSTNNVDPKGTVKGGGSKLDKALQPTIDIGIIENLAELTASQNMYLLYQRKPEFYLKSFGYTYDEKVERWNRISDSYNIAMDLVDKYLTIKSYSGVKSSSVTELDENILDALNYLPDKSFNGNVNINEGLPLSDAVVKSLESMAEDNRSKLGDYQYLVWDERTRENFINVITKQQEEIAKTNFNIFDEKVDNDIFCSRLLMELQNIKDINKNYQQSKTNMLVQVNSIK